MRIRRCGREHHVLLAAEPKNDRGDQHQRAGNTKGDARSEVPKEKRHERRSEERPKINDPVESVEHHFRAMLVRLIELVADERSHTRLDPARAERNQAEASIETGAVRLECREAGVSGAVDETQPKDGVVFAEKAVGQPAAQQREEVNANDESVENVLSHSGAIFLWQVKKQRRDEEDGQNVPHPVKTEALASLVADYVADLPGDRHL